MRILILSIAILIAQAEEINSIETSYEILDFDNSKKKESGDRYGIKFNHKDSRSDIQVYYEKTKTATTEIVPKDLDVNKYLFKYRYRFLRGDSATLLYGKVSDNLMRETDGGDVYGVGYSINQFSLMQYFIDYPHFNIYQSDFKWTLKGRVKSSIIGKYIHLDNKNSNPFSKNAKSDYFTVGVKLHTKYNRVHFGAGAFFGKRVFAIMRDGFRIQHHAMEFKETYMCGVGYPFNRNLSANLRYVYQKAKELPINNNNVEVKNLSLTLLYSF